MPPKKKAESKSTKSKAAAKSTASKSTAVKTAPAQAAVAVVAEPKVASVTVTMAPEAPVAVETTVVAAPAAAVPQPSKPAVKAEDLTIGQFQQALHKHGFYAGAWDGQYGGLTKQAVRNFQAAKGLTVDGEPTPATLAALGF